MEEFDLPNGKRVNLSYSTKFVATASTEKCKVRQEPLHRSPLFAPSPDLWADHRRLMGPSRPYLVLLHQGLFHLLATVLADIPFAVLGLLQGRQNDDYFRVKGKA